MTHSLFRVRLRVDRNEVIDAAESHTPREAQNKYSSWIVEPSGQFITFEGATFVSQVERETTPRVRVALKYNSGAHPLISGASIDECRPMTSNWLPEHLEDTNIDALHKYEVVYQNRGPNREESGRAALRCDVRDNFRYEIEDVIVEEGETTLEVYVPECDTGNHTMPQRLFPTAAEIRPRGKIDGKQG